MNYLRLMIPILCMTLWVDVMAKPPSTRPDWSDTTVYSLNLSGNIIKFILPGKSSTDFPNNLSTTVNIYDPDIYEDWKLHSLGDIWWDYSKKSFFITEVFGSLHMKVDIFNVGGNSNIDISINDNFQKAVNEILEVIYSDDEEHKRLPAEYIETVLSDLKWLKYMVKGKNVNSDKLSYALPITDQHYLQVSFFIVQTRDPHEANWYNIAQDDIVRIMNKFSIIRSTSAAN